MDFVIPWVNGNDIEWQLSKNKYTANAQGDFQPARFREWEILKYWFRGVEAFAPWVNKIHFITCGHVPEWLNLNHPKLNFVKHTDYIPAEYLPTFNSHTIEHNIHRIKGLSEQFVYFNDDMHIISPMEEKDFFRNGLPCDEANMVYKLPSFFSLVQSVDMNNLWAINRNFKKFAELKKHPATFFNRKYNLYDNVYALYTIISPVFPGFFNPHSAQSFLKSTLEKAWDKEFDTLNKTCLDKFRDYSHVNQYLYRYWQFAEGNITPTAIKGRRKRIEIDENSIEEIKSVLANPGKTQILCLNDEPKMSEASFDSIKAELIQAFEKLLPKKSLFEI